jgi:hypothetical protein
MVIDFKERISKSGSVKAYVQVSSDAGLTAAYNECVEAFAGLRIFHFGEHSEPNFSQLQGICTAGG